jgi:hypothetical protein
MGLVSVTRIGAARRRIRRSANARAGGGGRCLLRARGWARQRHGIAMCTPTDGAGGGTRREMWEGDGGRGVGGAMDVTMRLAGCTGTHLGEVGDCRRREKDYGWRNSGRVWAAEGGPR